MQRGKETKGKQGKGSARKRREEEGTKGKQNENIRKGRNGKEINGKKPCFFKEAFFFQNNTGVLNLKSVSIHRLEIQKDENDALKEALNSTLKAKEEDLKYYQDMMEQTKKIFLQGLRQFRQGSAPS